MGIGSTAKRRRTGTDSPANSVVTAPRPIKTAGTGRGRGRPPNVPRDGRERPPPLAECFRERCSDVLDKLSKKDHYNIFLEPVNTDDVAGYAETIKKPMDFSTMRGKLARHAYKSLGEFRKDLDLIWSNCLLFNGKEPTNVFSKKAIELRRLTEKLIVTTRQHLEKDKENVMKWKEKHRKRKETMQANAANGNVHMHNANIGHKGAMAGHDSRVHADGTARDPIDTSANDYGGTEHNGRTPQQNAIADSMRFQYAGTTGLYRKGAANTAFPQYTNPDGSVVQIPIRRYHPHEDHWQMKEAGRLQISSHSTVAPMFCDVLPPSRLKNPCRPRQNCDSMVVKDYADSLYNFVIGTGSIATEIVSELLSPELVIKKTQEDWLRKGFSLKDLANKARLDALRKAEERQQPQNAWTTDAICDLADEIEKTNAGKVSMLPQLSRPINELDGISGLRQFMDEKIVKEVDEVPNQVVDYSMPHGVNASTIAEICKLQNIPNLGISREQLQPIAALHGIAQNHVANLGAAAGSRIRPLSRMSASDLHNEHLRALIIRQHRRAEASKYAQSLQSDADRGHNKHVESTASLRERELELSIEKTLRERPQSLPHNTTVGVPLNAEGRSETTRRPQIQARVIAPPSKPSNVAASIAPGSQAPSTRPGANVYAQTRAAVNPLPPPDKDAACKNCGTRDTLGWRAGGVGPEGVERLCIPCGLYFQKTSRHRPRDLWTQTPQRKGRPIAATPPVSGPIPQKANPSVSRTATPLSTPNGLGKRSIQKTPKNSQSSARRSPSSSSSRARSASSRRSPSASAQHHGGSVHQSPALEPISFAAPSPQNVSSQMSSIAQLFTNQRNNADSTYGAPRNLQPASNRNRSTPNSGMGFANAPNFATSANASIQPQLPPSLNPSLYSEQHNMHAAMTSQQHGAMGSQGQANGQSLNYGARNNQTYLQPKSSPQQLLPAPPQGNSNVANPYHAYAQPPKEHPGILGMNGHLGQHANGNVQINMLQQTGQARNESGMPNGDAQMSTAHQNNNSLGPEPPLLGQGIGNEGISAFGNQVGVNAGLGSPFGDIGNNPSGSEGGGGSDPIVDDILFSEGALEAHTDSPAFEF